MEETSPAGEDKAKGGGPGRLGPVKRVVLKLCGEGLAGEGGYGMGPGGLEGVATEVG